jgi:hypothetical protein
MNAKHLFVTALVASLATFGCGGKDKEGGASGGKSSADAKAAFGLFTKNTTMVGGVNLAQLTGSDLYKKFKPMIDSQMASGEMQELKDKCGIDVMSTVKSIIIGGEAGPDMEPKKETMMMVIKGIERSKAEECGKKMEEGATVEQDGNFTKVTTQDGETKWYGWLDNTTVVVAPKMDKAALEARMAGKDGMDTNAEMMAIVGNTDQTASLWFAAAPAGGIQSPPDSPVTANLKAAFGSVKVSSGVSLDVGARTGSGDEASKLKSDLEGKIKEMKPMVDMMGAGKFVDKLKLSTSGSDMLAKLSLSGSDIDELQKLAGSM